MVDNWLQYIQEWFLPSACLLCGASGAVLCAGCRNDLPRLGPACRRCAAPLHAGEVCGPCQRRPPPFDAAFAAFRYRPPLDHLLRQAKFHQRLECADLLGELLAEQLAGRPEPLPEAILPVPLHPRRLWRRGYNQALELARPVARRLDLPLSPHLCRRIRATPAQSGLPAAARRRNLRGAFTVGHHPLPSHLAILDDILTTGSTVGELAQTLRRAGVRRVEVWAVARAL